MSGRRPNKKGRQIPYGIWIATIPVVGSIIIAALNGFFNSPLINMFVPSTLTLTSTLPPPTLTGTIAPTIIPTSTPTETPLPPPLVEIFPQAVDGVEFTFVNNGGVLTAKFVTDQNCVHSGVYGLRFTYDMQGKGNGGWGVHWVNPPITHFDASSFQTLMFWVKGVAGNETFQLAMKGTNGISFWIESISLLVVPAKWTIVSVPINKFKNVNVSSVENLTFGANSNHGSGSICLDDIAFTP